MENQSLTFPRNYFSKLDSIHVHVDGGVAVKLVQGIVDRLNKENTPSRLTSILEAVPGPQREDLAVSETYESHTPGTGSQEKLEYFSTTLLDNLEDAKRKLNRLLTELALELGIVIEAERVVGIVDQEIQWSNIPPRNFPVIHSEDVGFRRAKTLPIEIHYACDIPKGDKWQNEPPVSLKSLTEECKEKLDIRVGGWFLFDKGDEWAYRSNMFTEAGISSERVKEQRDKLAEHLGDIGNRLGFQSQVKALVEQSLGVWKTPLRRVDEVKTVQELAEWEARFPDLEKFWVISPNFLGDKEPDVHRAMVRNLSRNVKYTYFLQSFADFQRLRKLAISLEKKVKSRFDVFDLIDAVLLVKDSTQGQAAIGLSDKGYFIANPHLRGKHQLSRQGYRLLHSVDTGELNEGIAMRQEEIKRIVDDLQPLIEKNRVTRWMRIPLRPRERRVACAIIYTGLEDGTAHRKRLGENDWEQVLKEYDLIVADEVSKQGGEVVKNFGDGYLLIFEQSANAMRCAERLQIAVRDFNEKLPSERRGFLIPDQRLALDFGSVSMVIRAYGFDFSGQPLIRCAKLMEKIDYGDVCMTNLFLEDARNSFTGDWLEKHISPGFDMSLDELGSYKCYKLLWHGPMAESK